MDTNVYCMYVCKMLHMYGCSRIISTIFIQVQHSKFQIHRGHRGSFGMKSGSWTCHCQSDDRLCCFQEKRALATVLLCCDCSTKFMLRDILRDRLPRIGKSNPQGSRDGNGSSSTSCDACCLSCAPNSWYFSQLGGKS